MQAFLPYGEGFIGQYHHLVVQTKPGLYRVYLSTDGQYYGHCETVEHPGDLTEVIDSVCANLDTKLFEVNPVMPFTKEEVIAEAPHAFDGQIDS